MIYQYKFSYVSFYASQAHFLHLIGRNIRNGSLPSRLYLNIAHTYYLERCTVMMAGFKFEIV